MGVNTIDAMKTDDANIYIRKVMGGNAGRIREMRGLSQSELARMVDLDRSGINQFEGGKYNPSVEWLCKLADGLDVPVVEFFSGLEAAPPNRLVEPRCDA